MTHEFHDVDRIADDAMRQQTQKALKVALTCNEPTTRIAHFEKQASLARVQFSACWTAYLVAKNANATDKEEQRKLVAAWLRIAEEWTAVADQWESMAQAARLAGERE